VLTLEQVHERTGLSIRNIKYWSRLYRLRMDRRGRRNYYPPETVRILEAVAALAEVNLFTSHYLKWVVAAAQGAPVADGDDRLRKYVALYPSLTALPGLPPPPRTTYAPRDGW
jgi:hypothetical protein